MKKFYSIVLMATALLIGTNMQATTRPASSDAELQAAWKAAQSGDVIQLTGSFALTKTLWLGTATQSETPMSLTLDLNGQTLSFNATPQNLFIISHGDLNVITSQPGGQIVYNTDPTAAQAKSSNYNMFKLFGSTRRDVNPKMAKSGYYSHLTIEEGVLIKAFANAIVIDRLTSFSSSWIAAGNIAVPANATKDAKGTGLSSSSSGYGYYDRVPAELNTNVYSTSRGVANGVRLDVKGSIEANKYAIKVNGNIGGPTTARNDDRANFNLVDETGSAYVPAATDTAYSPFIKIHENASLKTLQKDFTYSIAAYGGGYARWLVKGYCEGSTGVYVKSGEFVLEDAVIKSNYTGDYVASSQDRSSGVDAGGSGIAISSATAYAGGVNVTVKGSTEVSGTSGYAIDESVVAVNGDTKVDVINIEGGTFVAGEQGAITISETTADATPISITGGTYGSITAEDIQIGKQSLEEFLKDQTDADEAHLSFVDGNIVVSEGAAPVGSATVAGSTGAVNWKHLDEATTAMTETLSSNLAIDELEINQNYNQTLTIAKDVTLTVGRVVMGSKAQIIVEAGAKLIVTGKQGVAAFVANNIVLRNEDGERSIFLFHPNVESNKHPMAKVELITNSWAESSTELQWEVVGFPTFGAVSDIYVDGSTQVALAILNSNGQFVTEGLIGSIDKSKLNKAFAPYDLLANRAQSAAAPKIVIEGELVGNINADLNVNKTWTTFANSYTGEIDLVAFLTTLGSAQNVAHGVYVAEQQGHGHLAWNPVDLGMIEDPTENVMTKLAPMQAFLLNNTGTSAEVNALNYASMVYAPAVPGSQQAPRRFAPANDVTAKLRVIVTNEEGIYDKVLLRENANDVYALAKYMNEDMNIYAMTDAKNAIVNAEDMENSYVGFSTVKGGKFTISFANVDGREFTLLDHETGARVEIAEGNTYEFTAGENSTNDYRFEIVGRQNMPTAIDNTEAVKSAKGVYTITGQYVGEMNVWNALPAGVYVVNGEKRVK